MNNPNTGRNVIIAILLLVLVCGCCLGTILFFGSNTFTAFTSGIFGGIIGRETAPEARLINPINTDSGVQTGPSQNGDYSEEGLPVQYGVFPIENGFGINAVFAGNSVPQSITFFANGSQISPFTVECRPFEGVPFYGYNEAMRCDYLFNYRSGEISVGSLPGYTLVQRGITLINGAHATSNSSWNLP